MGTTMQIFLGTLVLILCSVVHLILLAIAAEALSRIDKKLHKPARHPHWFWMTAFAFFMVVVSHTIHVWIWAGTFLWSSALPNGSDAIYFSLATYTTLGYGDVLVSEEFRIFAAMGAVTGLLNFGLSTAFLVGFASHLFPQRRA